MNTFSKSLAVLLLAATCAFGQGLCRPMMAWSYLWGEHCAFGIPSKMQTVGNHIRIYSKSSSNLSYTTSLPIHGDDTVVVPVSTSL
jgi:hypothetical protein